MLKIFLIYLVSSSQKLSENHFMVHNSNICIKIEWWFHVKCVGVVGTETKKRIAFVLFVKKQRMICKIAKTPGRLIIPPLTV